MGLVGNLKIALATDPDTAWMSSNDLQMVDGSFSGRSGVVVMPLRGRDNFDKCTVPNWKRAHACYFKCTLSEG